MNNDITLKGWKLSVIRPAEFFGLPSMLLLEGNRDSI